MVKLTRRYSEQAEPLRTERRFELAVVVLLLLLLLQLAYSGLRLLAPPTPEVILPSDDSIVVAAVAPRAIPSQEQSRELRARPVLWESRRPLKPVAEVARKAPKGPGRLKGVELLGVFGGGANAGIIARVNGKQQRVMRGESIAGWKLDVVEPDKVRLSNGTRKQELTIERRFNSSEPATANNG